MDRLRKIRDSEHTDILYAGLVFLVIAYYVFEIFRGYYLDSWRYMIPVNGIRVYFVSSVLLLGLFVFRFRRAFPPELWLFTAYFVWIVFTRACHGLFEWYEWRNLNLFAANFPPVLAAGILLKEENRERVLAAATALLCSVLLYFSVLGLILVFKGADAVPFKTGYFTILNEGAVSAISFFGHHRNIVAAWFLVGFMLLAYYFISCKKNWLRVLLITPMVLLFVMISLEHSRSVQISAMAAVGMFAGLWVLKRFRVRLPVRMASAAFLALLCALGCYKGLDACGNAVNRLPERFSYAAEPASQPEPAQEALPVEEAPAADREAQREPALEEREQLEDNRSFIEDLKTINGRTEIWKAGIDYLRLNPMGFLIGNNHLTIMAEVVETAALGRTVGHMHNFLLQALMVSGIPGMVMLFVAVLLFLIRVCKHCVLSDSLPFEKCLLAVIPTSILIYGFIEPLLYPSIEIVSLFFLLTAGIFIRNCRDSEGKTGE